MNNPFPLLPKPGRIKPASFERDLEGGSLIPNTHDVVVKKPDDTVVQKHDGSSATKRKTKKQSISNNPGVDDPSGTDENIYEKSYAAAKKSKVFANKDCEPQEVVYKRSTLRSLCIDLPHLEESDPEDDNSSPNVSKAKKKRDPGEITLDLMCDFLKLFRKFIYITTANYMVIFANVAFFVIAIFWSQWITYRVIPFVGIYIFRIDPSYYTHGPVDASICFWDLLACLFITTVIFMLELPFRAMGWVWVTLLLKCFDKKDKERLFQDMSLYSFATKRNVGPYHAHHHPSTVGNV